MSDRSIEKLHEDDKLLQTGKEECEKADINRPYLGFFSTKEDPNKEVEQFKSKLVRLLNNHIKIMLIMTYSKQWWNEDVVEVRKIQAKNKRRLDGDMLKQA